MQPENKSHLQVESGQGDSNYIQYAQPYHLPYIHYRNTDIHI